MHWNDGSELPGPRYDPDLGVYLAPVSLALPDILQFRR